MSARERRGTATGATESRSRIKDRFQGYLRHHQQELVTSLKRLRDAPLQTLMTSLVVAIALGLPAALYVGVQNMQQLSSSFETTAQLTIFLHKEAKPAAIEQLQARLQGDRDILEVSYISREQALKEFQDQSGFGEALTMLDENPLPPVLLVQPAENFRRDLAASEALVARLKELALVDDVRLDMKWIQRLQAILEIGHRLALSLGAALAMGVLLIVGNTIGLAIESRRDEIVVVKLVGGTDGYVRRPFLYTGIWYGAVGGIVAWLLVWCGLAWLDGSVARLASLYQSAFSLQGLGVGGFLSLALIGAGLGLAGAWLAVGRHLSHIEPS